jgi:hypothetical protein
LRRSLCDRLETTARSTPSRPAPAARRGSRRRAVSLVEEVALRPSRNHRAIDA